MCLSQKGKLSYGPSLSQHGVVTESPKDRSLRKLNHLLLGFLPLVLNKTVTTSVVLGD